MNTLARTDSAQVKDSFQKTEAGLIPVDWSVAAVGDVAQVKGGKRLPMGYYVTDRPTPHPYIRVTDMGHGTVRLSDIKYVPEEAFPPIKNYRITSADLYISVAGTLGLVGRVPEILSGANLTENANMIVEIKCDRDYLFYCLSSARIQNLIESERTVGAQPKLALGRIRDFVIAHPPLPEQRAIATALSDADGLLAGLDALIAKKKALKQGAMQQLLTGKQRLPGFKGEWVVASIEEIAKRVTGFWGSGEENADTPKRARIIRAGDVSADGKLTATAERFLSDAAFLTAKCDSGDVVITVSGNGLGKVWLCDGRPDVCVSNFVRALKPRKQLSGAYLYYQLCSSRAQQLLVEYTATSAYPNLRPNFFGVSWLPLPTLEEQTAIAEVLSDMDAELGALEARRAKTALLKQGMMQELLTGRTRLQY